MICDTPIFVLPKAGTEKVPVPCGRCPPCKLRRVNSWVLRLTEEQKVSSHSHFVTLTYDTNHVPISDNGFMNLSKVDFQLYMKRLRKLCPDVNLKYYAVGEYGTNNRRPHFHAIIFNVPDSVLFYDAWSLNGVPLGSVHIGVVTTDSIAYTMKYIDKQSFRTLHNRDDRVPEFALMSKGLGASYLSPQMIEYHRADISRLYATKHSGHRVALPRYYRHKIFTPHQLAMQPLLIQQVFEKQDAFDRLEFERLYGSDSNFCYDDWLSSKRRGRFNSFYSRQKVRNL